MVDEKEEFEPEKRLGLVVWLHSLKPLKQLKRHGHIHYVSRRMKYVYLYCDIDRVEEVTKRLLSINAVKSVEQSMRPFIKTEYQSKAPKEAKKEEYKMGI
ncbi:YlbG family protein [Salisediminibacterium beveridgei]|uniref:Uncharacterized protein n=1 Tax=Salisediminibacterium beveridgei TaxID=632773 RepID=A0A1D7QWA2_9BACI|nr:DUF2129 domain-containing protein [Salisediminibacterium beveridgei]AOM83293.1 hypothetical protein BBEV_1932 [Salisediminibacterium beveridgei]